MLPELDATTITSIEGSVKVLLRVLWRPVAPIWWYLPPLTFQRSEPQSKMRWLSCHSLPIETPAPGPAHSRSQLKQEQGTTPPLSIYLLPLFWIRKGKDMWKEWEC